MAFKFVKTILLLSVGMLFAPKKGKELRKDFLMVVKKNNEALKKIVNKLELVWEKSQGIESEEVAANIEVKINDVKAVVDVLDSATSKEMAYKILKKIDKAATEIVNNAKKSPNLIALSKDLASFTVSTIEEGISVAEDLKATSSSITNNIVEDKNSNVKKGIIKIEHNKKRLG